MSHKNIPVYHGGKIGIMQPNPPPLTSTTPIVSVYSGNVVAHGGIPWGTPNDAVKGQPNYGGNFHVINYNYADGNYYAHYCPSYRKF